MNELNKLVISSIEELKRISDEVSGSIIYNNKKYKKSSIIEKAISVSQLFIGKKIIINALPNSHLWWVTTLAGIYAGSTVVILSSQYKEDDIRNKAIELDAAYCFYDVIETEDFLDNQILFEKQELPYNGNVVLFTSGTQAKPKGVVIRIENYIPNLLATQGRFHMSESDSDLCYAPYSHALGFAYGSCAFFFAGDVHICLNELDYITSFYKKDCNITGIQPIFLERFKLNESFVKAAAQKSFVLVGGAPISEDAFNIYNNAGTKILNGYGMTECVAGVAITDRNRSSCDRGMDIMDSGIINVASDGEIIVDGCTVCQFYLDGNPTVNPDGKYHTGDVGYIKDNCLYITGRKDNIVVLENGYKICLESIEERVTKINGIINCLAKPASVGIYLYIVSQCAKKDLEEQISEILEYYEKPFQIYMVDDIEVQNGKKVRRAK